jgi:hypothetical protein
MPEKQEQECLTTKNAKGREKQPWRAALAFRAFSCSPCDGSISWSKIMPLKYFFATKRHKRHKKIGDFCPPATLRLPVPTLGKIFTTRLRQTTPGQAEVTEGRGLFCYPWFAGLTSASSGSPLRLCVNFFRSAFVPLLTSVQLSPLRPARAAL